MTLIRPFTPGDIEAAVALEATSQPTPWTEGIFVGELAAPNRVYLVADDQGMVGFGGVMMVGEECHVTNLIVDPERRGQGIGRSLLISLIEEGINAGVRHLTLEVRVGNRVARSLYSSVGLAPVGVRPGYYGHEDALILSADNIDNPEFQERLRWGTRYKVRGTASSVAHR